MDLGTNTFHLLIIEGSSYADLKELRHDHIAVKLGEGGINKGFIQPEAFERGLDTMRGFQQYIEYFEVSEVKAIATSALRSASNGKDFIDKVKAETGIVIETINGDTEAGYIYYGVKASGMLNKQYSVIVDIGGGSVEFIICNDERIFWKQSFEIGAARLMDLYHKTDPIPAEQINNLHDYLDEKLQPFFEAAKKYPINNIIGSSGAFETFAELAERNAGREFNLKQTKTYTFEEGQLVNITDNLIRSNHEDRKANSYIIPVRVDMIVVASIFTRYLMDKLKVDNVCMSAYSLKEGVLAEILS